MKHTKLLEAYQAVTEANNFTASASEFRLNLGKALNSLTVLKDAPIQDREKIEAAIEQLHQTFNLAMEIENELETKAKDELNYP